MNDDPTQPNTSKHPRPEQLKHLSNDQLVAAVLRLTMEISVIRDRLATCESLLRTKGVLDADDVDQHQLSAEESAERAKDRVALIEKVVGDLS